MTVEDYDDCCDEYDRDHEEEGDDKNNNNGDDTNHGDVQLGKLAFPLCARVLGPKSYTRE
jgi:hypothetical protein